MPMPDSHSARRSHSRSYSVLAWAAWQRVLALLPVIALLWLAVAWANLELSPW